MANPPHPRRKGLITATELARRLPDVGPDFAIVDMRRHPDDGLPVIPGSAWVDLHDGFAQRRPERNLAYDLPTPGEVAGTLARLGIAPGTEVVFADDMLNRWATRAYWVLAYYRHPGATWVLDGGLPRWRAEGLPGQSEFAIREPSTYPSPEGTDGSIRATAEELLAGQAEGRLLACDVRAHEEFTGHTVLAARGGRIPGAAFVPFEHCLADDHTFLDNAELEAALAPFLAPGREPVTYCQGGIRASLTWFSLHELLGLPARLYPESWEEWGGRPDLPLETG